MMLFPLKIIHTKSGMWVKWSKAHTFHARDQDVCDRERVKERKNER